MSKSGELCRPSISKRNVYSDEKFTPEEIRKDENISWEKKTFFYGGKWREIRYKEVSNILWENGTKRMPQRLITLAPLPYVRGGEGIAVYSALLMANIIAYKDRVHPDCGERHKWRKEPKRNTCRALVGLLRGCLLEEPELLIELGLTIPMISVILRQAA